MRGILVALLMLVIPAWAGWTDKPVWLVPCFGAALAAQNLFRVETYNIYRKRDGISWASVARLFGFGLAWNSAIVGVVYGLLRLL
jgi:hypothetical protein